MAKLTKAKCNALTKAGLHGDGGGLYLHVKPTGGKSWCQRITIHGRRRTLGLGSFPLISLAKARALAALNRATVAEGGDPLAEKRRGQSPTYRVAAKEVYELNRPRWRSDKHAADWWATLERHALPSLGDIKVDAIDRLNVLDVLTPIWTAKPETARRVRQRIRTVMRWALAHGYAQQNPAGEVIDGALPAMPKIKAHLRALPYLEVPMALAAIDESRSSLAARACFRFLVLTAVRSGTARGALWAEIDIERREWNIPGFRMSRVRHIVFPCRVRRSPLFARPSRCATNRG
ncbi:MAG: integrase arm-type DNA-binding domain-containing protein [Gammaproteobacteria bacterium]|nr:integrase arm-type DNA-binding domain-containing protein [Gammaproteobacteria bacterium]